MNSLFAIIVMVVKHNNILTYTSPTLHILGSLSVYLFLLTLPSLVAPVKFHLY